MFPFEDLGGGLFLVRDSDALAQIFGRSGLLGDITLLPGQPLLPASGKLDLDYAPTELGIRVNGHDHVLIRPAKPIPVDTLADAEKSLLLSKNPYLYNDGTRGQEVVDTITGVSSGLLADGDVFEFWYRTPENIKIYSSQSTSRFSSDAGANHGNLKISMDVLLEEEGDPLFYNYSLATGTFWLKGGSEYTLRLSSAGRFRNHLHLYRVDDASGRMDGISPGQAGYQQLAWQRLVASVQAPDYLTRGEETFSVGADQYVASFLETPDGHSFFPWSQQNPDGIAHAIRVSEKTFAYEDIYGGGDRDFQDLIFSLESSSRARSADRIVLARSLASMEGRVGVSQHANALAVKDGVIIALGDADSVRYRNQADHTIVEDYRDGYFFPGFVDPHEHMLSVASYAAIPGMPNITWPDAPGAINTYERITEVLIDELVRFEHKNKLNPFAWFGAFGIDPSLLGNPQGSGEQDRLSTIYQQAFGLPPRALVKPAPGYGDGQTYLNWLNYISSEAEKRAPGAGRRPIALFYASGHAIAINDKAVDELALLGMIDPAYNFSILKRSNNNPSGGQPGYLADGIGGYFLRDGEYGRLGCFSGLSLEPQALAPISIAFVLSRFEEIYGKLGTNLRRQALAHAMVGITAANDKTFGTITVTADSDFLLQGMLQSSGYLPIRLFVDPVANTIFTKENTISPFFTLTPFQGNLSSSPKAIKFILDGSNQAQTGRMPEDDPYLVLGNSGPTYNPAFTLFEEKASGWLPIGIRDYPYGDEADGSDDTLLIQLKKLWDRGWGFHAHANGQQATSSMLALYQQLAAGGMPSALNSRPQVLALEHLPFATDEQLQLLGRLKGFASLTKGHLQHAYQFGWKGESYNGTGIVGQERGNGVLPIRTALESGVGVSMHSDFPIDWIGELTSALDPQQTFLLGPLDFMNEMTTRILHAIEPGINHPTNIVNPDQRLTREQAFLATTLWLAQNMSFDPWLGSLEVGKLADFTLMNKNILDPSVPLVYASPGRDGVSVLRTWVGGVPIYTAS